MIHSEEREVYFLKLDGEPFLVSLTSSQVSLLNWLKKHGYSLEIDKKVQNPPIVI